MEEQLQTSDRYHVTRLSGAPIDGVAFLDLAGEIDAPGDRVLEDELVAVLESGAQELIVDMSKVAFISLRGINALARSAERLSLLVLESPNEYTQKMMATMRSRALLRP